MSNEDFEIFLEDFYEFLNNLEASVAKMRIQLEKLIGLLKRK